MNNAIIVNAPRIPTFIPTSTRVVNPFMVKIATLSSSSLSFDKRYNREAATINAIRPYPNSFVTICSNVSKNSLSWLARYVKGSVAYDLSEKKKRGVTQRCFFTFNILIMRVFTILVRKSGCFQAPALKASLFFFVIFSSSLSAENFGVHGHTFAIEENDLLQVIQSRLYALEGSGELEQHKQAFVDRTQKRLRNPPAVEGIRKATENRTYYYDPTLFVPYALKDHEDTIFQHAGARVSPLETHTMRTTLVFIQGEDADQVAWAARTYLYKDKRVKIILVSGSPFDLMEAWDTPVYFDQAGVLTKKLGIDAVPAVVEQEGVRLKISEIKIQGVL